MTNVQFHNETIGIDASIVGEGLGLAASSTETMAPRCSFAFALTTNAAERTAAISALRIANLPKPRASAGRRDDHVAI